VIAKVEASARTGRIILLFTIVTIIFLPLSFLTAWFGMNIKDPNAGSLSLNQIAAIIFPISIGITLLTVILAFNHRLRNAIETVGANLYELVRKRKKTVELSEAWRGRRRDDIEMQNYGIHRQRTER
jgi:CorA-like Mg2+ transporter protein